MRIGYQKISRSYGLKGIIINGEPCVPMGLTRKELQEMLMVMKNLKYMQIHFLMQSEIHYIIGVILNYNMVMATMAGNFQDSSLPSKIQMGTAWWFQDHRDGMEEQMRTLANEGLLGRFIGMLTDSRSFLSYPRHEYFRRILCNLIGEWVEKGEYPYDKAMLKTLISGISFYNAKHYFGI